MTDGLTSSLINSLGFEMEYCYYYVNVSRMLPVEESVPKSVQIIGLNGSAKAVDLFVFVEYAWGRCKRRYSKWGTRLINSKINIKTTLVNMNREWN